MTKYHPSARVGVDDFVGLLKRVGMGDFPRSELEILFETYKEDERDETIELNRFVQDLGQMLRGRVTEENTLKLSTSSSALGAKQRTLHNIAEVERSREAADVTEEEAEELFFEKLAQRLPQGALALERAFRKAAAVNEESMNAQVSYEDFCRVIQRLGLEGLSNRVTQELFARYRPSGQEVSYEELVRKMASRYAQTRQSGGGVGGLAQQMQLSRNVLQAHKEAAAKLAPAQGARHVNVAKLLLEKVEQRIHGEHQLRRCFRRTELDSDWSKLSFVEFQHGLIALGVTGVPDVAALAYFKEFDPEGTGYLDFPWRAASKTARPTMTCTGTVDTVGTGGTGGIKVGGIGANGVVSMRWRALATLALRVEDLRLESVPEPRVAQHYQH
ncbi:Hypothetical Protein FCC1311_083402 [Hondaea fermentalgiana]|uniref:Uncharacterized protein n=1 Tax=Hondaea fermentalgiana TaxID=2315210 RepID=A0A2R5GNB7_9STRA|nr:Hypothetical Protein FCC1311_083402 [Hondaea fermentalgiana]|eukprot:GBG32115.1 Hypothetical Protein FCC1311_083402 [Hondaea fermentalgiana]